MKEISKTEWNMTHNDYRKFENGQHYIYTIVSVKPLKGDWVPVKIKGVKKGEKY
jgi:hypothetical protein